MQKWTKTPDRPIEIAILLFDQFSNHCLANCIEPFRAANSFARASIFKWQFLTLTGEPVQSSSGLPILPDGQLNDLKRCDYLFVNISYDYILHDTARTRMALQKAAKHSDVIVGLDMGAWLLASAGLLDGKRATVHWDAFDAFSEKFPDVDTVRERITSEEYRMTCAGAMSAFDLSLMIINNTLGSSFKLDIEAFFIHQDSPTKEKIPIYTASNPLVQKTLRIMRQNIENPLSRDELAHAVSCQPKTLERRFKAEYGIPTGQVYRHIRLTAAREMVIETSLSMLEIALRSGFQDASAMTRAFKTRFGAPPSMIRKTSHILSQYS